MAGLRNLMCICALRTSDLGEVLVCPQEGIINVIPQLLKWFVFKGIKLHLSTCSCTTHSSFTECFFFFDKDLQTIDFLWCCRSPRPICLFCSYIWLVRACVCPRKCHYGKDKFMLSSPHSELLSYWGAGSQTWGCGSTDTWFLGEASCSDKRPLPRQLLPSCKWIWWQ